MKPKSDEKKVNRLLRQYFSYEGNPSKQKVIEIKINAINKTKKTKS